MYQVGGENWFFRALVPLEAEEEKGGFTGRHNKCYRATKPRVLELQIRELAARIVSI
jgi:hypothetical protein